MLSNRLLAKICAYGTFGVVGAVIMAHEEVQSRIRKSNCYIDAFKYLQDNTGAVKYFGEPLKAGYVVTEPEGQDDSAYWYKVPLKGPTGKGCLHYKAMKEQNWFLARVELELEKIPGQKFVLLEKPEEDPEFVE